MALEVKICGLATQDAVDTAVANGASMVGFVFYPPSPRNITPGEAAALSSKLPAGVKSVAVMVNPPEKTVAALLEEFRPDYVQLHGNETPALVKRIKEQLGVGVIKAFTIRNGDDVAASLAFDGVADMLLFDAKVPKGLPGGNGLSFDWTLLQGREFTSPWLLSGGMNAANVKEAATISGAQMVDVSSSVECAPGVKDVRLIKEFLNAARSE